MAEKCIRAFRMKSTPQQKYLRLKNINDQTKLLSRTQINNVEKEKIKVLYVLYFTLEKKKTPPVRETLQESLGGHFLWDFVVLLTPLSCGGRPLEEKNPVKPECTRNLSTRERKLSKWAVKSTASRTSGAVLSIRQMHFSPFGEFTQHKNTAVAQWSTGFPVQIHLNLK